VTNAAVHPDSAKIISWLSSAGGWGNNNLFQIDWSMTLLQVGCNDVTEVPFVPKKDYYEEACDNVDGVPLPADGSGALESGERTWKEGCSGDCHLLVHDTSRDLLYESWDTDVTLDASKKVTQVTSTCLVVWNVSHLYPPDGRGDGCTSADAAGFPIAPLLFTADEIENGSIDHAIRFILPNNRMRAGTYMHPASHYGGPQATDEDSVVYGSRFRLKAEYDISGYKQGAQVVLRALKKYGMLLSDGGNIALTALNDDYSGYQGAKYAASGFGTRDLHGLLPVDFEMLDGTLKGPFNSRPACERNDIPLDLQAPCLPDNGQGDDGSTPTPTPNGNDGSTQPPEKDSSSVSSRVGSAGWVATIVLGWWALHCLH